MSWLPESKDHLPLTWWKGHPVYLSAMIALGSVVSMIATAILMGTAREVLQYLAFDFGDFAKLQLWTPVTYVLVNPPGLMMLLGCFFFWRFGEAVERHLGRRSFVRLLVILLLVSPLLVTLISLMGRYRGCAGVNELQFGVFIAFASLYPRVQLSLILFTIEVWVLAAVLVGISALSAIAAQDWMSLLLLAGQVGTAFAYIRYEQGALTLPKMPRFTTTPAGPAYKTGPQAQPAGGSSTAPKVKRHSPAVDDILDKISREGMQSLSPEERKVLDQASEDLQKRNR